MHQEVWIGHVTHLGVKFERKNEKTSYIVYRNTITGPPPGDFILF